MPDPRGGEPAIGATDVPLDLRAAVLAVDRRWPSWERAHGRRDGAPWGFLVGVERAGARVVHRPLPRHPALILAGWSAPGCWCAVGVAVRGTAHRPVGGGAPAGVAADASANAAAGVAADARVVWICHRDGRSASLLGLAGEPANVVVSGAEVGATDEGLVPLLLRGALEGAPPRHRTDTPGTPAGNRTVTPPRDTAH